MKIFKTLVTLIDLDSLGHVLDVDTIEYKGKLWLVPEWIDTLDGVWTKPARIICLTELPFEKNQSDIPGDYVLQCPMTKAILNGQIPTETTLSFVIVEDPNVEIQRGDGQTLQ